MFIAGYLLSLVTCCILIGMGWRRSQRHPVVRWTVVILGLALTWWTGAVLTGRLIGGPHAYPGINCTVLPIVLPAVATVPAALLVLSRALADMAWRPSPLLLILLAIEPILITVAGATNASHHGVISCTPGSAGFGALFWVHSVYCYLLIGIALAIIGRELADTSRRAGLMLFFVSIGICLLGNALTLASDTTAPDFAAAFFGVGLSLLCYTTIRHHSLDSLPMARARLLDLLAEGVLVLDSLDRQVHLNPAARTFLIGSAAADSTSVAPVEQETIRRFLSRMEAAGGEAVRWNGREIEVRTTGMNHGNSPSGRILVLSDVTELMRTRRELDAINAAQRQRLIEIEALRADLAERVIRDPLTGLYNRAYLDQVVESTFAEPAPQTVTVAVVDIDHFKAINDGQGHPTGDRVLIRVAALLQDRLGQHGAVTRLGGDEFLVLASGPAEDAFCAALNTLVATIESEVSSTVGLPEPITISVGVASTGQINTCDSAGTAGTTRAAPANWRDLVAAADVALYQAKARGRNRMIRYEADGDDIGSRG